MHNESAMPGAVDESNEDLLLEELAALQHEIWAHWMIYLFKVSEKNADGSVTIPKDKVQRWIRQMDTSYSHLSTVEQRSDIHQAEKVLALLQNHAKKRN